MTISVNGSKVDSGQILFDTGIDYSFIRLSADNTNLMNTTLSPDKPHHPSHRVLVADSTVVVQLDGMDPKTIEYRVNDSDAENRVRPYGGEFALENSTVTPAFINTGRYFYRGFDAMLDVECGLYGLRRSEGGIKKDILARAKGSVVQSSERAGWEL